MTLMKILLYFSFSVVLCDEIQSLSSTQCSVQGVTKNLLTGQVITTMWMEIGSLTITDTSWTIISTIGRKYNDPIVFISLPEISGDISSKGYPVIARIRNLVNQNGQIDFETKLYQPNDSYCSKQWHIPVPIPQLNVIWTIFESGAYNISLNTFFVGKGSITRQDGIVTNENNFIRFNFPIGCGSSTSLCGFGSSVNIGMITQLQTLVYDRILIPRIVYLQRRFSRIILQPHDSISANYYSMPNPETLGYFAFMTDITINCLEGFTLETHRYSGVTNEKRFISFHQNYESIPGIFGIVGTSNSLADSTSVRIFNRSTFGTDFILQEDQCVDEDTSHTTKETIYLMILGKKSPPVLCMVCNAIFTPGSAPPTSSPTQMTTKPSVLPTRFPSILPTQKPTLFPFILPSRNPTQSPFILPTQRPTLLPTTKFPSTFPTVFPSPKPSIRPSMTLPSTTSPSKSLQPSRPPTISFQPTSSKKPSFSPTKSPAIRFPSALSPSRFPTLRPSLLSTPRPTSFPVTRLPTLTPSTLSPPSSPPSLIPSSPSFTPSLLPSTVPSSPPSLFPSITPSFIPSFRPTSFPSPFIPTKSPSRMNLPTTDYNCYLSETEFCSLNSFPANPGNNIRIIPPSSSGCSCIESNERYSFVVTKGDPKNVLIYFQGGGICWNKNSFLSGSCRTYTLSPAEKGVLNHTMSSKFNSFATYTTITVPYCSGDFFLGNNSTDSYSDSNGKSVRYNGIQNVLVILNWLQKELSLSNSYLNSQSKDRLILIGSSAGSIAAQIWSHYIFQSIKGYSFTAVLADSLFTFAPDNDQYLLFSKWKFCQSILLPIELRSYCPVSAPSSSPSSLQSTPSPTLEPSRFSSLSSNPSRFPSTSPTSRVPLRSSSQLPSRTPTQSSSGAFLPSRSPSFPPSRKPSTRPSFSPSKFPSYLPSRFPSSFPSLSPSFSPSLSPSFSPTLSPSLSNAYDGNTLTLLTLMKFIIQSNSQSIYLFITSKSDSKALSVYNDLKDVSGGSRPSLNSSQFYSILVTHYEQVCLSLPIALRNTLFYFVTSESHIYLNRDVMFTATEYSEIGVTQYPNRGTPLMKWLQLFNPSSALPRRSEMISILNGLNLTSICEGIDCSQVLFPR